MSRPTTRGAAVKRTSLGGIAAVCLSLGLVACAPVEQPEQTVAVQQQEQEQEPRSIEELGQELCASMPENNTLNGAVNDLRKSLTDEEIADLGSDRLVNVVDFGVRQYCPEYSDKLTNWLAINEG